MRDLRLERLCVGFRRRLVATDAASPLRAMADPGVRRVGSSSRGSREWSAWAATSARLESSWQDSA